jgi:hypothetical protein
LAPYNFLHPSSLPPQEKEKKRKEKRKNANRNGKTKKNDENLILYPMSDLFVLETQKPEKKKKLKSKKTL